MGDADCICEWCGCMVGAGKRCLCLDRPIVAHRDKHIAELEAELEDKKALINPDHQAALAKAEKAEAENTKLQAKNTQVCDLISESQGIAGLHLNGDIATWEELMHSFDFHTWLDTYAEDFPVAAQEEKE